MRVAWATGLALAVLAASPARADEWTHQYPLKGGAELHVKTDDGSVRIETGAGSEIDARVTTVGWRIAPGEVTITESQTGDRVDIEVRLPKNRPGWGTGQPVDHRRPASAQAGRPLRPHRRRQHRGAAGLRPPRPLDGRREHHCRRPPGSDPPAHRRRVDPGHGALRPARGRHRRRPHERPGAVRRPTCAPVTAGSRPPRRPGPRSRRRGRSAAATGASRSACPRGSAPTSTPTRATAASCSTSR